MNEFVCFSTSFICTRIGSTQLMFENCLLAIAAMIVHEPLLIDIVSGHQIHRYFLVASQKNRDFESQSPDFFDGIYSLKQSKL